MHINAFNNQMHINAFNNQIHINAFYNQMHIKWGFLIKYLSIVHIEHTAIPNRESTGFLQGIPCVVFPPLHALAVYRVWRVQISLKYREIYAFCTGI